MRVTSLRPGPKQRPAPAGPRTCAEHVNPQPCRCLWVQRGPKSGGSRAPDRALTPDSAAPPQRSSCGVRTGPLLWEARAEVGTCDTSESQGSFSPDPQGSFSGGWVCGNTGGFRVPGAPLSEGGRRGTREGRGWAGAQRRGRPPGPPPVGAAARAREREVRLRAPFRPLCRADVGRGRRKLLRQPTPTARPSFARDREREGPCWHAHSRSLPVSFSPQSCQADLVKDNGHKYFLSVLADPYMPVRLRPLPGHPRGPCRPSRRRVMLWGSRGRGCSLRAGAGGARRGGGGRRAPDVRAAPLVRPRRRDARPGLVVSAPLPPWCVFSAQQEPLSLAPCQPR